MCQIRPISGLQPNFSPQVVARAQDRRSPKGVPFGDRCPVPPDETLVVSKGHRPDHELALQAPLPFCLPPRQVLWGEGKQRGELTEDALKQIVKLDQSRGACALEEGCLSVDRLKALIPRLKEFTCGKDDRPTKVPCPRRRHE